MKIQNNTSDISMQQEKQARRQLQDEADRILIRAFLTMRMQGGKMYNGPGPKTDPLKFTKNSYKIQ